ncbi:hypothetical protein KF728_28535 [Candidatus Obscuribacterales bacterium]|nr:hypothetical protein [Candidatus Obscuribacterales bacterium]
MLKPNRQILLVAMAIGSGVAQPAFCENQTAAGSLQKPSVSSHTQSPVPQSNQPSYSQSAPATVPQQAVGTAPTLGEVLEREAQQQGPSAPLGYPSNTPPYAQGAPVVAPNTSAYPQTPQGLPGYVPNAYPQSGYPGGGVRAGVGNILNEVRGMVQNMVQVNPGSENVRVRVPFVNVDVNHGQPNVKVNAPFVKVDKAPDAPVSVNAPFVNVSPPNP